MKKVVIMGIAVMAFLIVNANAGDYHTGASLNCNECHVMHYSQTHGYNSDGSGSFTPLGASGPYEYLLRDEINSLCLSCHDNQSYAPDVLAANGGNIPTNGREAGALNRDNTAPYFDATGHTLGSSDPAPGGTWSNPDGLNCVDCHQPHGYGGYVSPGNNPYRNLLYDAGGTAGPGVSYAVGTNDLTKDVFELSAAADGDHYDIQNIHLNEPSATGSAIGAWCKGCHTDFHGSSSDANMRNTAGEPGEDWYRHPTADADIGALGGGHSSIDVFSSHAYRVHVMSPTGDWGTWGSPWTSPPADLTPTCISCHKGHGNQNAFGLIYATGAANWGEDGDGTSVRDLCMQCHVQGG
ncbi:MAG: cytochrome c3 family protein [Candidatus Zixiibacteriota bacterium]